MREGYFVCLSVTALAATAFVSTCNNGICGIIIGFSWISTSGFSKKLRSKVMAWKSQYANELELAASRFRAVSGPTKHTATWRATGGSNVASEASYWCNRRETSEIQARAYSGSEALVRACAVYTQPAVWIPPRVLHFSAFAISKFRNASVLHMHWFNVQCE